MSVTGFSVCDCECRKGDKSSYMMAISAFYTFTHGLLSMLFKDKHTCKKEKKTHRHTHKKKQNKTKINGNEIK